MASRHLRMLLKIHKYRDEVFYLLLLLVERQCLHTTQSSMAEHLFSLIRTGAGGKELTRRQLRWSLVLLILLPYVQRKMERMCTQHTSIVDEDERGEQAFDNATVRNDGTRGFEFPIEARQWARMTGGLQSTSKSTRLQAPQPAGDSHTFPKTNNCNGCISVLPVDGHPLFTIRKGFVGVFLQRSRPHSQFVGVHVRAFR